MCRKLMQILHQILKKKKKELAGIISRKNGLTIRVTLRQVQQTEVAAILDHSITGTEIKVSGLASWTKTG